MIKPQQRVRKKAIAATLAFYQTGKPESYKDTKPFTGSKPKPKPSVPGQ
jgi:hypothetical protein